MTSASDLTLPELVEGVRACTRGVYDLEAAAELLIRHDTWLHRPEFLERCVWTDNSGFVGIEWEAVVQGAGEWAASPSELAMLAIAASLAGHPRHGTTGPVPLPLGWAIGTLDRHNVALVLAAVSHAAGAHQHVEHLAAVAVDGIVNIMTTTPRLQLGPLYPWPQTVDA